MRHEILIPIDILMNALKLSLRHARYQHKQLTDNQHNGKEKNDSVIRFIQKVREVKVHTNELAE